MGWTFKRESWSREVMAELDLKADRSFWSDDWAVIMENSGGCGPGKFGDLVVPDTMWGLDVKGPCIIHDWDYYLIATKRRPILHRNPSDHRFHENLVSVVRQRSKFWLLKFLRLHRAYTYYLAVTRYGDDYIKVKDNVT